MQLIIETISMQLTTETISMQLIIETVYMQLMHEVKSLTKNSVDKKEISSFQLIYFQQDLVRNI